MEDLARAEYPAMLASLQPNQAVQVLTDRVKRISKINLEIADWLQERRRIEEQYATSLRRLGQLRTPNAQSDLGVFTGPWSRVIEATETMASSHLQLAERIERDVEHPLRSFHNRKDVGNMNTISTNLATMAKALEEAQDKSEKLGKKGGKANTQKVDAASSKLESATQQWESQAPFIFESLQALDESRVNQLRDLLTQFQTHEADCAQRIQEKSADTLAQVLEISSETEIQAFVNKATLGRARLPTRTSTRRSSVTGSSVAPPSTGASATLAPVVLQPPPVDEPEAEVPASPPPPMPQPPQEPPKPESKLRRLGTMFGGRRRQSVHGAIGLTPQKSGSAFGRLTGKDRPGISPRTSSHNLQQENSRLGALAEAPPLPRTPEQETAPIKKSQSVHEGTNGFADSENIMDSPVPSGLNGTHDTAFSAEALQPSQTTESQASAPPQKDSEGFTIPAPANDPISEAQKEAAGEEADQFFKLNIQNTPVEEEDPEAKQAALSNVVNSLRIGPATRRAGTVRGRRDVRNTIYAPAPTSPDAAGQFGSVPGLPGLPGIPGSASFASSTGSRAGPIAALASEASVAGSDTQSVRSGNSLGSLVHNKHPELTAPGLQSSIIESISAHFEGGEMKSASIAGEIAFVSNPSDDNMFKTHETIRINNFPNLGSIGPNRIFVSNASIDQPDQFALELSHIQKTSTAFSYRVFAPEGEAIAALGKHAPLLLKPAWKPQGDKLGLLLQYQLNPASNFTGPVTLHNVAFVATYEGKASGAQTKPSGTHLKDRHIVYWRLGDVTLTNEPQKIVCRIVGAEGVEPTPGRVEARWEFIAPTTDDEDAPIALASGISISRLGEPKGKGKEVADDPFSDEVSAPQPDQSWVDVPLARKLVSGKYDSQ